MIAVRMMKVSVNDVVGVVSVGHCLMATPWTMLMCPVVGTALMGRTGGGIGRVDVEDVFFDPAIGSGVVKMPVVNEVHVAAMFHCGMTAALAVGVLMIVMLAQCLRLSFGRPKRPIPTLQHMMKCLK